MGRLKGLWNEIFILSRIIRTSEDIVKYTEFMAPQRLVPNRPPLRLALERLFARWHEPAPHALHFVESLFQSANLSLAHSESLKDISCASGAKSFLQTGRRISGAALLMVEWLRSRLPGYPFANLAHLSPWASQALPECFFLGDLPWPPRLRALGFQRHIYPPETIGSQFGIPAVNARAFSHELFKLASLLQQTDPWVTFERAQHDLDTSDNDSLGCAWREYSKLANPAVVEQEAGVEFSYRDVYRRLVLRRLIDQMTPRATAHCRAFERVEAVIEIIYFLLSTLVIDGIIKKYSDCSEFVSFPTSFPLGQRQISFVVSSLGRERNLRKFVYLEDEFAQLSGLMYTVGTTAWWGRNRERYRCVLVEDSFGALPGGAFAT